MDRESSYQFNSSLGSLVLNGNSDIYIQGHDSSIESIGSSSRFVTYMTEQSSLPTLIINDLTVTGFGGTETDGGVMYIDGNCNIQLMNATFTMNQGRNGGVIYMNDNTYSLGITDCMFEQNTAAIGGGVMYAFNNNKNIKINNTVVDSGEAGSYGGAVHLQSNNQNITIANSTFNNLIAVYGGILSASQYNKDIIIDNVVAFNCVVYKDGGSFYLQTGNSGVAIKNSLFNQFGRGIMVQCYLLYSAIMISW